MIKIKLVKQGNSRWHEQRLYHLSEPISFGHVSNPSLTRFILISSVNSWFLNETIVFAANERGKILNYMELRVVKGKPLAFDEAIKLMEMELEHE